MVNRSSLCLSAFQTSHIHNRFNGCFLIECSIFIAECSELENEFLCDDGTCMYLEGKCDGEVFCDDGSDERDCGKHSSVGMNYC